MQLNGYVKTEVWSALGIVEKMRADEVEKQTEERQPANMDDVIATLPFLEDHAWAMIRLLMLS